MYGIRYQSEEEVELANMVNVWLRIIRLSNFYAIRPLQ